MEMYKNLLFVCAVWCGYIIDVFAAEQQAKELYTVTHQFTNLGFNKLERYKHYIRRSNKIACLDSEGLI